MSSQSISLSLPRARMSGHGLVLRDSSLDKRLCEGLYTYRPPQGLLALCAGLFVGGEKRAATPLIDTALLRNGPYWMLTLAGAVVNTATVVHLFVVPLSLQGVWGLSPLQAGVAFLAPAALLACFALLVGERFWTAKQAVDKLTGR